MTVRQNDSNQHDASHPTLTVVIPHFNHGAIVPRAVASVLNNNIAGVEIIIVDDGSTDGSKTVLDALALTHPAIRVIHADENRGTPAVLNIGLTQARGRFVSFLGADDFALPELYRTMIASLEKNRSAAFACSRIVTVGTDGGVLGVRPFAVPAQHEKFLSPQDVVKCIRRSDNWICNTSVVYRTDMLRQAGGFDVNLGAFCDGFVSRVLAFTHGFIFVPRIHGVWQVAPETLSASSMLNRDERNRLIALARESLAGSLIGHIAPDYPDIFSRRLRFSAARMQFLWYGDRSDLEDVVDAAGGNGLDRTILTATQRILGFGRFGRMMAIGWLAFRLRPMALTLWAVRSVQNRIIRRRTRRGIEQVSTELEILSRKLIGDIQPSLADSEPRRPAYMPDLRP